MSTRVQLPPRWVRYLTHQPESRMGYQRVNVVLDDGTTLENCVVFNAEEIELPDGFAGRRIEQMTLVGSARPHHPATR